MAIVVLGQTDIFVGELPYFTNTFSYRDSRAYGLYVDFASPNFSTVYSFIRIYPYVFPTGGIPRLIAQYIDLQIIDSPQLFYVPLSGLVDGNGDMSFRVERLSFWTGGGSAVPVTITVSYDDNLFVNSWLN